MGPKSSASKRLYDAGTVREVDSIGPYLAPNVATIVSKRSKPMSRDLEAMQFGNKPVDGGALILDRNERNELLGDRPETVKFIRRLYGSQELMKGIERWCLWVAPADVSEASGVKPLADRFDRVRTTRLASSDVSARKMADTPSRFREQNVSEFHTIMVPAITSENRTWLPIAVMPASAVPNNKIYAIYDGKIWQAGVLSSRLHRLWLETVGGRLKADPSYSNQLVWNTFPLPPVSDRRKAELEEHWWEIDRARKEAGFGRTLGDLYVPKSMPVPLRQAHEDLDATMEAIFGSRSYRSDADRIEHLLQLYDKAVAGEPRGQA